MTASRAATVHNAIDVLLEMAADPEPVSHAALDQRCGLGFDRLGETLQFLSEAGLISRQEGSRGRYHLSRTPRQIPLGLLDEAAGAPVAGSVLPALGRTTTLADLRAATDSHLDDMCPYYEACVALGGPGGPGTADHCHPECAD